VRSATEPASGLGINTGAQRSSQSRHIEGVTGRQLGVAQLPLEKASLAPQQAADGVWTPTGCGPEPTPPVINGSSSAAYEASVKEAQAFQATAKQYNDCYFKEGQADSNTIGATITDHQHQLQAAFDKLSADSKAAVDRLNKAAKKQ